jgi:uncharacterized protein (DUF58 family)
MKWFAGALLILAVSLALELPLLAYAMYVLLGLLLVSRVLSRKWVSNLVAERDCQRSQLEIGDKLAVSVKIRNDGPLAIPWLLVEDLLPQPTALHPAHRVRVDGDRLKITALGRGKGKLLLYQLQFPMRGYYQIGPVVFETGDLFGLHRRFAVETEPHFVLVLPKVVSVEGYDLASPRPIGDIRLSHRIYEDPTRISGVRLYQRGDPLSRIHWKATARTGVLHSKTFEPSVVAGATILLDYHSGNYPSRTEPARSEMAITTAASLAAAVDRLGQQVGLVSNARDAVDRIRTEGWQTDPRTRGLARQQSAMLEESDRLRPVIVPTRRGGEQLPLILETLARAELTNGFSVSQLLAEVEGRLPRDATVVAILGAVNEDTVLALAALRRRGYSVSAIMIVWNETEYLDALARFAPARIELRRVSDEASLAALCQQQLARGIG